MKSFRFSRTLSQTAFTLVELLVVIAIIGALAAIALPAYNNYTLKSKFSEVVLATAPIKSAISACAATGDCVSGGAIALPSLGGSGGLASASLLPTWHDLTAAFLNTCGGFTAAQINSFSTIWPANYSRIVDPNNANNYCMQSTASPGSCVAICTQSGAGLLYTLPATAFGAQYVQAAGGSSAISLPCTGAAGGCSAPTKYVASASADASGIVTATAQSSSGLHGETFVLTPAYSSGRIDWSASGTCKTRAGGALC